MSKFLFRAFLCALICGSSAVTASETFTDKAEFENAVCGTAVSFDYGSLVDGQGNNLSPGTNFIGGVPSPQDLAFGTLSQISGDSLIHAFSGNGNIGLFATESETVVFAPDSNLGPVEGFCFRYGNVAAAVNIYDGTTLIESIVSPPGQIDEADAETHFGWVNSDNQNVTRVEISPVDTVVDADDIIVLFSGDFSFGEGCDPPEPTCLEQLEAVAADVASIPATGSGWNDYLIGLASAYLDCATHESLWADGDSLANSGAFYYTKKATKFLQWASDSPEIEQALLDIQAALACIVDKEIEAATAAGGNACNLAWAQYYQDAAEVYAANGHYRFAVKLRKWAWQCARWSY